MIKEYIVKVDSWGIYKKGDVLNMHITTGEACGMYVELKEDNTNTKKRKKDK